jgi:hypothetical protein
MLRELMYKWFGLDVPVSCETCEVLRAQLDESNRERKELLHRLLDREKIEPSSIGVVREEENKAITPAFVPWRVKQQMLEAEDRKSLQLRQDKMKEIENLEKELGVSSANERIVG